MKEYEGRVEYEGRNMKECEGRKEGI
jgi:hypothetical protein